MHAARSRTSTGGLWRCGLDTAGLLLVGSDVQSARLGAARVSRHLGSTRDETLRNGASRARFRLFRADGRSDRLARAEEDTVEDNRRPEQDEIRRAAGRPTTPASPTAATDTTQTFGHDSDLSFVPFGSDLSEAELEAIDALPTGAALLIVRSGPTAGARYLLDTDVTTVGRHPEADIFFDDVTVSRRHAEITRAGTTFELVDQRSLNGTYVNGERVDRATLAQRLRGAHRQVPPQLLRLAGRPRSGRGRVMPAASARERSSSAGLLSIGQVLAQALARVPDAHLEQAPLPRGAGHRHAAAHRVRLPQVLAGRPRAAAPRAHAAARPLPAARR